MSELEGAHGERKVGLVVSVSGDLPPHTTEFTCFTTGLTEHLIAHVNLHVLVLVALWPRS